MRLHRLEVAGDFACFTRPEFKVERVSYDVMTPSAARAVFDAILWKPGLRWRIEQIDVLKPIKWMTLCRNEVGTVASIRDARAAMKRGRGALGLIIEERRQQRTGLVLRDVAYRIAARLELTSAAARVDDVQKFSEIFTRRARKGQCFSQPYLGCREFSCGFRYLDGPAVTSRISESRELGLMLYDLDFADPTSPRPRFFRATLRCGVLAVPPWDSPEVFR